MNPKEMSCAAVLDPTLYSRELTRQLLAQIGLPACGFESTSQLLGALTGGQHFELVVLAFEGGVTEAQVELEQVRTLLKPHAHLMLLMTPWQVPLAARVMSNATSDFLRAPYTGEELQERLWLLYRNASPTGGTVVVR